MADDNSGKNENNQDKLPMRIGIGGQAGPMMVAEVRDDARYLEGISRLRRGYQWTVHGDGVPAPQLGNPAWVRAAVDWYGAAAAFQQEFGEHNIPCDITDAMAELRRDLPEGTLP